MSAPNPVIVLAAVHVHANAGELVTTCQLCGGQVSVATDQQHPLTLGMAVEAWLAHMLGSHPEHVDAAR